MGHKKVCFRIPSILSMSVKMGLGLRGLIGTQFSLGRKALVAGLACQGGEGFELGATWGLAGL